MERMGLVSHIEGDLERAIVLGLLPKDGFLPSEQLLARQYGVSRTTARQALLRLAARGLVVQHPGRRSRAVPLPQAVTLENLSMVLHAESPAHSEGRRLLGGYLALKRETMVELLAACCEHASKEELRQLGVACFALGQTAPWEDQRRWVEREFELLRLAALVVNRPGQFLLIQSLERSFWAMAGRLLPHLDCEAVRQWSRRALQLLDERDVQALRRELPALVQVVDERLLNSVAPAHEPEDTLEFCHTAMQPLDEGTLQSEPTRQELPESVLPNQSACPTGSTQVPTAEAPQLAYEEGEPGAVSSHRSTCPTGSCQASPTGSLPPAPEGDEPRAVLLGLSTCPTGLSVSSTTGGLQPAAEEGPAGEISPNRSACPTGSRQVPSTVGEGVRGHHTWSPMPWALAPSLRGCSGPPLPPRWISWKNGIRGSVSTQRAQGAPSATACGPGCVAAGSVDLH
jgi:DNA-binding FadR family transcriptional regulator